MHSVNKMTEILFSFLLLQSVFRSLAFPFDASHRLSHKRKKRSQGMVRPVSSNRFVANCVK